MDIWQEADILVLYYTGTGNSGYVAKKVGEQIEDEVLNLFDKIKGYDNNVSLKDGKLLWGDQCTHCMACICKCPKEAIEYGNRSKGKPRYQCPL